MISIGLLILIMWVAIGYTLYSIDNSELDANHRILMQLLALSFGCVVNAAAI